MMPHITEDKMIQYLFKLVDDDESCSIKEHIEQCSECRDLEKTLRARFRNLDLLEAGDVELSDELVSGMVNVNHKPWLKSKWILPGWLSAAAVFIISAGVFFNNSDFTTQDKSPGSLEGIKFTKNEDKGISIDDKPPFAPASAIELVVLPRRENLQLTVYNSADLTMVTEQRNLTMKRGWNWLQLMWENTLIDGTSLELEPLEQKDKIEVQQLVYPARLKDIGRWLIRSEITGNVPFKVSYFTSGISWRAFYMGTLNQQETEMQLSGYVRVQNNSGEDYQDAQTRLIVGEINLLDKITDLAKRQYPYTELSLDNSRRSEWSGWFENRNLGEVEEDKLSLYFDNGNSASHYGMMGGMGGMGGFGGGRFVKPKEIIKQALSEYFLYSIEGRETIPNQWGKRLPSFSSKNIPVTSLYKYDEERWGSFVKRFLSFENDEDHKLGRTPIPEGNVKVYRQVNDLENLVYTGTSDVKYIPVNEKVELDLGNARHVKIEPVLMNTMTDNYQYDNDKNISGWDEIQQWKIDITNARDLPVDIEITRQFKTPYWDISLGDGNVEYEKHDATHCRFKLTVNPESKRTINYTLTEYHGVRQEIWKDDN